MTTIEWKRGDSFVVDELGMLVDGVPLDMTGWDVASQIRIHHNGALVCALTRTWTDRSTGKYRLAAMDTTAWPLCKLAWDVQYTDPNGYITSSDTIQLICERDETRP